MRKRYLAVGCVAMGSLVTVCLCMGCIVVWQSFIPPEFWHSSYPSISGDGRYVAFSSSATNLVPGDTKYSYDIFVHDRQTGQTTRASVASDGTRGYAWLRYPSISADGRYVAFASEASNVVAGDTRYSCDIFVHDRQTGQTTLVSVASDGTQAEGGFLTRCPIHAGCISADGRYVAFTSYASNLVAGDTKYSHDIFVHDRQTGQTTRVSVASDGTPGNNGSSAPSISADGRYVAFTSYASLAPGDTNRDNDIFVHDRQTGQTTLVSVASDGRQGNKGSSSSSISADGRYVAFSSWATNLVPGDTNGTRDIFVHDRETGQTTRASVASDDTQGNNSSRAPSISADGRYVAFASEASNLVPGDTNGHYYIFGHYDIFVHDRQTGQTERISVPSDGTAEDRQSRGLSISADGRYVAFGCWTKTGSYFGLPQGPTDVFVHDRQTGQTTRVSPRPEKPWWRKIF